MPRRIFNSSIHTTIHASSSSRASPHVEIPLSSKSRQNSEDARERSQGACKPEGGRGRKESKGVERRLRDSGRSIAFSSSRSLVPAARSASSCYRLTRGCEGKKRENEGDRKSAASKFALRSVHTSSLPCTMLFRVATFSPRAITAAVCGFRETAAWRPRRPAADYATGRAKRGG